jgi:hypothetical protein
MPRYSSLLIALLALVACTKQPAPGNSAAVKSTASADSAGQFGDPVAPGTALEVNAVLATPAGQEQEPILVSGRVAKVCQASGCWLELEGSPSNLTLVFETAAGEQYTVPKELAGQAILAQGKLERVGGELQFLTRGLAVQR